MRSWATVKLYQVMLLVPPYVLTSLGTQHILFTPESEYPDSSISFRSSSSASKADIVSVPDH